MTPDQEVAVVVRLQTADYSLEQALLRAVDAGAAEAAGKILEARRLVGEVLREACGGGLGLHLAAAAGR